MDSMAAQKDADFCVKEEPRMAVEDLVQLFVDRDNLAKYVQSNKMLVLVTLFIQNVRRED